MRSLFFLMGLTLNLIFISDDEVLSQEIKQPRYHFGLQSGFYASADIGDIKNDHYLLSDLSLFYQFAEHFQIAGLFESERDSAFEGFSEQKAIGGGLGFNYRSFSGRVAGLKGLDEKTGKQTTNALLRIDLNQHFRITQRISVGPRITYRRVFATNKDNRDLIRPSLFFEIKF